MAAGDVVALQGPLGSGKTTLVRALVRALHGSDEAVSSPTFVFRQRYDPPAAAAERPAVEHLDLFRLENPTVELPELALDDAFAADRIVMVEWPERAPGWLPERRIDVRIEGTGEGPRTLHVARRPAG